MLIANTTEKLLIAIMKHSKIIMEKSVNQALEKTAPKKAGHIFYVRLKKNIFVCALK